MDQQLEELQTTVSEVSATITMHLGRLFFTCCDEDNHELLKLNP